MKLFLFGTGYIAQDTLRKIPQIPQNIEILGFIDNDLNKSGKKFHGIQVYTPLILQEADFDELIILSDNYFEDIKEDLIYWHKIDARKIKNRKALLKLLLIEKL